MKIKVLALGMLFIFLGQILPAKAADNALRLELGGKLVIPQEKADEVWAWLQEYFINNQNNVLQFDPGLTSYSHEEVFVDTYYDTVRLALADQQGSVRHRQRENLTNPEDRKSGRELVQLKLTDNLSSNGNLLNRQEYKYTVDLTNESPNQHQLIGIIAKPERGDFINRLAGLGIQAQSLKPILTINDFRRRIYFDRSGQPFISLSLDQSVTSKWWFKSQFIEIEPQLVETTFTSSDEAGRIYMKKIVTEIIQAIQNQFPEAKIDFTPKYNKAFNALEKKIPYFRFLIRWGII